MPRACSKWAWNSAVSGARFTLLPGFMLAATLVSNSAGAQQISNRQVAVHAVRQARVFTGFDLLSGGHTAATVRLSSGGLITAGRCEVSRDGRSLAFHNLTARPGSGLQLGSQDEISVSLQPDSPYPTISFHLTIRSFNPEQWKATVGQQPFHFLALYLSTAEAWHQRGWLNATPLADPFPLLEDPHGGTPEISSYHYNRSWSYTPPLGAHPLPVIGLWAPQQSQYVGFEFQTTRLEDNSEKDIATGYHWSPGTNGRPEQFVTLVYPYGGRGYQDLVFPTAGSTIASHGTLLWSLDLPANQDPNRFFWQYLWQRAGDRLPTVPRVDDLSWLPGGDRLRDFEGPPGGVLIGRGEPPYAAPGTVVLGGWRWQNESPATVAVHAGDQRRLDSLNAEAQKLLQYAKHFRTGGDDCVYWQNPLEGQWAPQWGGPAVTSTHNATGFAAGRLFLGLYRDAKHPDYLPVVDGVLNWARHIAWTRNEFADVPSSPFAIGGTLAASFCLDYYSTFRDAPDDAHRQRARQALDMARSFTYRYMILWPSDNDHSDNLHSAFLWEPNSGRDWTGAACANEVFWNLDTLAQTAVETGDPILMWALQGSLDRWYALYQDVSRPALADYTAGDMAEGYGLYAGNIYGVGQRASYGFSGPLDMIEPVGDTVVRVLAGERAAMAFDKNGAHTTLRDYHCSGPGNFSFTLNSSLPGFNLSLTAPYTDISQKPVILVRQGVRLALQPGQDLVRPPQAPWSLVLRNLKNGDQVIVGTPAANSPALSVEPPRVSGPRAQRAPANSGGTLGPLTPNSGGTLGPLTPNSGGIQTSLLASNSGGIQSGPRARKSERRQAPAHLRRTAPDETSGSPSGAVALPYDTRPDTNWDHLDSWAGLPRGRLWAYGVSFQLGAQGESSALSHPHSLFIGPGRVETAILAYSSGPGPLPSLLLSDGSRIPVDSYQEALAWRAWPPIYSARLLIAPVQTGGKRITGIDPGGRLVWALTALSAGQEGARIRALLQSGAMEWQHTQLVERQISGLRAALAQISHDRVAILPPGASGGADNILVKSGIGLSGVLLSPAQLVDPAFFNAHRFPIALYLDEESYLDTIRTPGDGSAAIERYLQEGGTLVLVAHGPYPMYYAAGPGGPKPDPLLPKLGMPLANTVELTIPEKLTLVQTTGGKNLFNGLVEIPYPPGDPRLRVVNTAALPAGAHYTPLYTVRGASGKSYGDAAGLFELPGGKGKILYFWGGLLRDPDHDFPIAEAIVSFVKTAAAG